MMRKTVFAAIVAAGLLGGAQVAAAQTPGYSMTCVYPWCVNYVQVTQNASGQPVASVYWNEMKMAKKLTGATVLWMLVGSPDYEFRGDAVAITGPNAAGSALQFPLRQMTADRYALDDLNTNDLPYSYEVRVYKKGAPAGTPPVVGTGSVVVNAFN